ncbi:MATE family efflux transporter [Clostridia bacterium]|nr:MATE family efflux transporter [Clostridia bacterium]
MEVQEAINQEVLQKDPKRLLIQYAIPSMIAMLSQALYILIDGIFIGNFVGAKGLAAINLVMPAWSLMSGIGLMLSIGGGTLISIRIGQNDRRGARLLFARVFTTLIILSLFGTVVALVCIQPIAYLLGATETILWEVMSYIRYISYFFFAYLCNYFLDYILRASNQPKRAMHIMVAASLLNILLDYLAIVVLDWGVKGAAVASGLAMTSAFILFVWSLRNCEMRYSFMPKRIPRPLLFRALYNGSSELFTELSFGVSTLIYNLALMRHIGVLGVSAFAVVTYINVILAFLIFGFGIAMQPLISINYGAGRLDRVRAILRIAYLFGFSLVAPVSLLIFTQRGFLVGLFVSNRPDLVALSTHALGIITLNFIFMCFNVISSSYFTAIEWAGTSAVISILRGMVFTFIGVNLLPLFLQTDGIWWTSPFTEFATLMVAAPLLLRNMKKMREDFGRRNNETL